MHMIGLRRCRVKGSREGSAAFAAFTARGVPTLGKKTLAKDLT
jgi:hypothetical protein